MILWTVMPLETIFSELVDIKQSFKEIRRGHMTMIVEPGEDGYGTIVRLISPNCNDYLNPEYAPGAKIRL